MKRIDRIVIGWGRRIKTTVNRIWMRMKTMSLMFL